MRTLTKKYLGGYEVDDKRYKVDIDVLEKYQSFTTEVLRLSLLGIAGYGFLITNIALKMVKDGDYELLDKLVASPSMLAFGAIALGISAGTALGHRYFSTDCLTHFVRRIRLDNSLTKNAEQLGREEVEEIIQQEEDSLEKDLSICKWLLIVTAVSLGLGVISVALAFATALF